MTSNAGININFDSLPIELQNNIFKNLTLEELFALNRMHIRGFELLASYIDDYLQKEKYKEQTKLKDCMFLLNFEEYRDSIYDYLYELVSTISVKFVQDVITAGGTIGFMSLALEKPPRNIYSIEIVMKKGTHEFKYTITSLSGVEQPNLVQYNFGYIDRPPNTRSFPFNLNIIVDALIEILELMKLDGRRLVSIRYYREAYSPNFMRLKIPVLFYTEGYHLY